MGYPLLVKFASLYSWTRCIRRFFYLCSKIMGLINLESTLGNSQFSPTLMAKEHLLDYFAATSGAIRHTSPLTPVLKARLVTTEFLSVNGPIIAR